MYHRGRVKMRKNHLCGIVAVFLLAFIFESCLSLDKAQMPSPIENQDVLLFSYFTSNGQDGYRLLSSLDGYHWFKVNKGKSFLKPVIGEFKLMRDPCIIKGKDDFFHLIWTTGWNGTEIGYSRSADLINWEPQRGLGVMDSFEGTLNSWAPELFYNQNDELYYIFWASTIPGKYPVTDDSGDNGYNHRIYYTTTSDFIEFNDTELFYDEGFNVIDNNISKLNDGFVMFLKNETKKPAAEKNLRVAFSQSITGPWSDPSEPIHGDYWAEGPSSIFFNDQWFVYFDRYAIHSMGLSTSLNLEKWVDESDRLQMPKGTRHGTVLKVSADQYKKLLQ